MVALRPEDKEALDRACAAFGQDRNEFVGRLVAWFLAQPAPVRLWALGMLPIENAEVAPIVDQALDWMAQEVQAARPRRAGRDARGAVTLPGAGNEQKKTGA